MALQDPSIPCKDIPLEEAHSMRRGPRLEPWLYQTLKDQIHSRGQTAAYIMVPASANRTTMKPRSLRVAQEIHVSVTIRRVAGGLVFWRSTNEDLKQANEVAERLHAVRRKGRTRLGRRWRASMWRPSAG